MMTLSQISTRSGALFAAVLTSSALLFGAPAAHAAPASGYYKVELAQPAAAKKAIIRGVVFQCEGTTCMAAMSSSTARNVCISVARELGEVSSFKTGPKSLDATELATCNEKKKINIARD
jgi:hypothetical protein